MVHPQWTQSLESEAYVVHNQLIQSLETEAYIYHNAGRTNKVREPRGPLGVLGIISGWKRPFAM